MYTYLHELVGCACSFALYSIGLMKMACADNTSKIYCFNYEICMVFGIYCAKSEIESKVIFYFLFLRAQSKQMSSPLESQLHNDLSLTA